MSELHDIFWTLCRKLPSDFTPYGQRDRDTAEPCADCSCGCRHFIPLTDELGNDWGVCANPKSPRAGLLTFEHQGCPEFASEAQSEIAETPPPPLAILEADAPDAPRRKLKVDFGDLLVALEGFGSSETKHYLDTETGEVIPLYEACEDCDEDGEIRERIEADVGGRYQLIEQLESHESFRIMEDFAASLPESPARTRLLDALTRNKPFRRFKDALHSDIALGDQWFAFRDDAFAEHVSRWLEALGIEVEFQGRPTK